MEFASARRTLFGKQTFRFRQVTSSNDIARHMAQNGSPEGTVVTATYQTRGRGQRGNHWVSPEGKSVLMSVILRPKSTSDQATELTKLAASSVARALGDLTGLETQVKWPNDVLIHQRKVAGILTEITTQADRVEFAVMGIGINVNTDKEQLADGATSLKVERQQEFSISLVSERVLAALEEDYLNFLEKARSE